MKEEKKDPPLTIEKFYEKTQELNDVYQNNQRVLYDDFMRKQETLFMRMRETDRVVVIEREKAKMQEAVNHIVVQDSGLVDQTGRKITTH